MATLCAIPDAALERPWHWRGELDVRTGIYRQQEELEDHRARIQPLVAAAVDPRVPALPLLAGSSAARWELYGLLSGLEDADLDHDPGNGEWTVRQTVAHIVSGHRGYAWYTAWWLAQRFGPSDEVPPRVPEESIDLPEEETEGRGSLEGIQRRFDEIVDLSIAAYAPLTEGDLAYRARWSGVPVDIRFRLMRWASHIREHTIQVEKTLGYFGHVYTEVDRLMRLTAGAYGRLEEELLSVPVGHQRAQEAMAATESLGARLAQDAATVAEAAAG